ncbi:hypothetical protein TWF696_007801 [Orbilia brochopaga]|uniref:Uncharacterized protein n=1 Tax=Orbilia brochopaga TaxID=3140254 RepID=A0AAV9UPY7_9PEZI
MPPRRKPAAKGKAAVTTQETQPYEQPTTRRTTRAAARAITASQVEAAAPAAQATTSETTTTSAQPGPSTTKPARKPRGRAAASARPPTPPPAEEPTEAPIEEQAEEQVEERVEEQVEEQVEEPVVTTGPVRRSKRTRGQAQLSEPVSAPAPKRSTRSKKATATNVATTTVTTTIEVAIPVASSSKATASTTKDTPPSPPQVPEVPAPTRRTRSRAAATITESVAESSTSRSTRSKRSIAAVDEDEATAVKQPRAKRGRRHVSPEPEPKPEPEQQPEAAIQEPVVEEPIQEPVTEELIEKPVIEEPVAQEPVIEQPVAEELVAEEPVIEEPVGKEPITEEPVEKPITEEPVEELVEEPIEKLNEELVADEPVAEDSSTTEELAIEEPVTEDPATEEPAAKESEAAQELVIKEQTIEEQTIEEQIIEEQTVEEEAIEEQTFEEQAIESQAIEPAILEELSVEIPVEQSAAGEEPVDEEPALEEQVVTEEPAQEVAAEELAQEEPAATIEAATIDYFASNEGEEDDVKDVNATEASQQLLQEMEFCAPDAIVVTEDAAYEQEETFEQEANDVEMMDVDPTLLMEDETNQTPEKQLGVGIGPEAMTPPSALNPMSEAAVNAGHTGMTDAPGSPEYATPMKEPEAPPRTPARVMDSPIGPMTATPRWQFMRHVPTVSSPLKRPPLTYSPGEATPPRRMRVSENGIVSGSADPSPLRTDELNTSDFDTPANSPGPLTPRRVTTPVPRKRGRSRSVRRESSPLKNAVDFSVQDGGEGSAGEGETLDHGRVLSPLPWISDYDPNQDISELREEEVPEAQVTGPIGELLQAAPPPVDDSDIPMSSPMATPVVVRRILQRIPAPAEQLLPAAEAENVAPEPPLQPAATRPFEAKRQRVGVRHSTGTLSAPREHAEKSARRSTMSGPIDATALPTGNIKHPRAAEARHHYLGPPPVVSADDYQSQFKSSVLGATSPTEETPGPVVMEDVRGEDAASAPASSPRQDAAPAAMPSSATPAEASTDQDAPGEYVFPNEEPPRFQFGRSYGLFISDESESGSDNGDKTASVQPPPPPLPSRSLEAADRPPVRSSPRRDRKPREPEPEKKTSRIPLLKSAAESKSSGSPFRSRLNRVTQTTNLPDRELSKLTARNTTRNGVYKKVNFERKVVRLQGQRPPSPTRETQTAAAEMSRSRRKKVFEETGVALGPGDEVDYVPPESSADAKRVRWHELLECRLDEKEKARFRTKKGILAPERVRTEESGVNQVTIQKFLYDGEKDIFEEED